MFLTKDWIVLERFNCFCIFYISRLEPRPSGRLKCYTGRPRWPKQRRPQYFRSLIHKVAGVDHALLTSQKAVICLWYTEKFTCVPRANMVKLLHVTSIMSPPIHRAVPCGVKLDVTRLQWLSAYRERCVVQVENWKERTSRYDVGSLCDFVICSLPFLDYWGRGVNIGNT